MFGFLCLCLVSLLLILDGLVLCALFLAIICFVRIQFLFLVCVALAFFFFCPVVGNCCLSARNHLLFVSNSLLPLCVWLAAVEQSCEFCFAFLSVSAHNVLFALRFYFGFAVRLLLSVGGLLSICCWCVGSFAVIGFVCLLGRFPLFVKLCECLSGLAVMSDL